MANVFLTETPADIETAILYEKATIHDIKDAVAYVNAKGEMFVNTEDNLNRILPNYNDDMLRWILWHERYHTLLKHPTRYFNYMASASKFTLTHNEVNIIMDILVHDQLATKFPDLVDLAIENLSQFRHRNSLMYTFKTYTLEEMLQEYQDFKDQAQKEDKGQEEDRGQNKEQEEEKAQNEKQGEGQAEGQQGQAEEKEDEGQEEKDEGQAEGQNEGQDETEEKPTGEHSKSDWSKLKNRSEKEFITERETEVLTEKVNKIKTTKIRLATLTETLNGLSTSTRKRSYAMPSSIRIGKNILLKGSTPGKAKLHLCFDASGSMGRELDIFKRIIDQSIPQALLTPTTWFSGYITGDSVDRSKIQDTDDNKFKYGDYYKGTFKDMKPVYADDGYIDDGDRTIELCWIAEQQGYTPIGITDGGGRISWSESKLKELKRTLFVVPERASEWADKAKEINPHIQIIIV